MKPKAEGEVCPVCGNLVYVVDEEGSRTCGSCGWARVKVLADWERVAGPTRRRFV